MPGVLEGDNIEHQLTIDLATGIPCIAETFVNGHEKLRNKRIFPIPANAISLALHSADGTSLKSWDIFASN